MELRLHITHLLTLDDAVTRLMRLFVHDLVTELGVANQTLARMANDVQQLREAQSDQARLQEQIDTLAEAINASTRNLEATANHAGPMPLRPATD